MDEGPENKIERERMIKSHEVYGIIMNGVRAAGIEYDKIPAFTGRLREVSDRFAEFPSPTQKLDEVGQKTANELRKEAARTNPYKDGEKIKEKIWQFIQTQLNPAVPEELRQELKILISDIIEDERTKEQKRREYEKKLKRR